MGYLFLMFLMFPLVAFADTAVVAPVTDLKGTLLAALFTALATVLVSVVGYLGKLLGSLLTRKINDIDNDMLQKAAYVAVRFVNDAFKKVSGTEKFKLACAKVAEKLPGVNGNQIEEAVRAMYINMNAEIPKNA